MPFKIKLFYDYLQKSSNVSKSFIKSLGPIPNAAIPMLDRLKQFTSFVHLNTKSSFIPVSQRNTQLFGYLK